MNLSKKKTCILQVQEKALRIACWLNGNEAFTIFTGRINLSKSFIQLRIVIHARVKKHS